VLAAATAAGGAPDGGAAGMHALCMALEHERMHQETLCYMVAQQRRADFEAKANGASVIRQTAAAAQSTASPPPFYFNRSASYLATALVPVGGAPQAFVTVPGGAVQLGLDPLQPRGFVWDNELGLAPQVEVPPLRVAPAPVTVAQFWRFVVEDRGYQRPELWPPQAFEVLKAARRAMPATWSASGPGSGDGVVIHMPEGSFPWTQVAACPVYVSLVEAQAYCALHGARVASEAEFHHVVSRRDAGCAAAGGIAALDTGGWEWTATPLAPFDEAGFEVDRLYPEYSADFFDARHFVLRGSSPYSHPSLRRATFRNFYQAEYPFVLAKFRLVKELPQ
jgi:formylglycine-generating enzyme required for sulfatase activity